MLEEIKKNVKDPTVVEGVNMVLVAIKKELAGGFVESVAKARDSDLNINYFLAQKYYELQRVVNKLLEDK